LIEEGRKEVWKIDKPNHSHYTMKEKSKKKKTKLH